VFVVTGVPVSSTRQKMGPGTVRQQLAVHAALKLKITSVTSQPAQPAVTVNKPTPVVASVESLDSVIECVARGGGEIKRSSSGRPLIKKKLPLEEPEKIPEKRKRGRPPKVAIPIDEVVITIDDAGEN
jgi:hypothetical protein